MNSIVTCEAMLRAKIQRNISELWKGVFVSRPQAIAVAYKQVETIRPGCRRVFSRQRKSAGKKINQSRKKSSGRKKISKKNK